MHFRTALARTGLVLLALACLAPAAPVSRPAFTLNIPLPATPAAEAATTDAAPATPPASEPLSAPVREASPPHSAIDTAPAARQSAGNDTPREEAPVPPPPHVDVRGLYMTGFTAGDDARFHDLLEFMDRTGLNAVVIDAKDDDGRVSWQTEVPLARAIGAGSDKIKDPAARLAELRRRGIYAIARIVVYADPRLAAARPELAIFGGRWRDTRGIAWPDPYNRAVWEYNVDLAAEAVRLGFQEIQFDYIRFPEHLLSGYNRDVPVEKRTDAIEGFLRHAVERLRPLGAHVAADVFGLTTSVAPGDDMEIGQVYERIAAIVDYILPMAYPSHYAPGTYGLPDPERCPGEVVYESTTAALKRTPDLPKRKHRPWIQDFSLRVPYGRAEVEAQVRGLARAGIRQFILWDPNNRYTRNADYAAAAEQGLAEGGRNSPPHVPGQGGGG